MSEIILKSKPLFPRQLEIINDIISKNCRYNIINASRQFGKSTLLQQLLLYWAFNDKGCKILYVSPTFALGKSQYRSIIDGLPEQLITEQQKQELFIKFASNSSLTIRSAMNPDAIRGGSYTYVFVDEMSFILDDVWQSVIRPTMNVIGKQAIITSTPRGKNLFYQMAEMGNNPEQPNYSYNFGHYTDNPYYNLDEVTDARETLPDAIFRQEYEAEFLDSGGGVFGNIDNVCILTGYTGRSKQHFAGLDLGRLNDWTVLSILNEQGQMVDFLRVNKLSWETIVEQVISMLRKYNAYVLVECNGIGDVLYEMIHKKYGYSDSFITTNQSKSDIIENLILTISQKDIQLPTKILNPELYRELSVFSFKYSPASRKIIYEAPAGFHDDITMSLSLANQCRKKRKTGMSFSVM